MRVGPRWRDELAADFAGLAPGVAGIVGVQGVIERFPRAYREDAGLAPRVLDQGWTLHRGTRQTTHPVRPAGPWASLRAQAGNAGNALIPPLAPGH